MTGNTEPANDEWDDLDRPMKQTPYWEPLFHRDPNYRGPAAHLEPVDAITCIGQGLDFFGIHTSWEMPMPPSCLPFTRYPPYGDEYEVSRLLKIGFCYALAALRHKPRKMHNLWNEANSLIEDYKRQAKPEAAATYFRERVQRTNRPQLVYFIAAESGPIKIGKAANPEQRCRDLQTGHHERLEVLATCDGGSEQETAYHQQFAAHRRHGEWFNRHPDILAEIERLSPPT